LGQVIDVFVCPRRDTKSARRFFERAICAIKVTPVEVTTDQAPVYPAVLEALVPVAWRHTDQYAKNRVECDHGRLKARLRPMRGLKQDRRAAGLQRQSDRRRARFRTEPWPRPLRVGGGGADDQAAGGAVRRAGLSGLICGGVVASACSGSAQRNNALDEYLRHYNDQRPHRSLALRPPRGVEVRAGPDG
jgi:murein DD-endopeptidase MepM/ murein hydrolase activator NlpD